MCHLEGTAYFSVYRYAVYILKSFGSLKLSVHALKVAKFQFILERDLNRHMTAKIIHLKIILKAFSHTLTDWRKLLRFKKY